MSEKNNGNNGHDKFEKIEKKKREKEIKFKKKMKKVVERFSKYGLKFEDLEHFSIKIGDRKIFILKREYIPTVDKPNGVEINDFIEALLKERGVKVEDDKNNGNYDRELITAKLDETN